MLLHPELDSCYVFRMMSYNIVQGLYKSYTRFVCHHTSSREISTNFMQILCNAIRYQMSIVRNHMTLYEMLLDGWMIGIV